MLWYCFCLGVKVLHIAFICAICACRFAFLEYKDKSAAQEALQNDRMELDGRTLSINFAKPRGSSRGGGGGGRRGGGNINTK